MGYIVNRARQIVNATDSLSRRSELTAPLTRILICETVWGWSQKPLSAVSGPLSGIGNSLMAKS
jgi:hypothetical protein